MNDHPKVIALPPLIYFGFFCLGLILEFFWRTATFSPFLRFSIGPVLIGAAISLGFQALREFRRADTNVEVYKPATALITTGPYRFTRNPLYICLTLVYVGAALMADSLWVLALLVPVLVAIHYGVVLHEEQYLLTKFGAVYREYQKAVRRWL